ncbi:MAG: YigZ family protein [Balneolaceae bacterium]
MFTIKQIYKADYRIKGSKFHGFLCPAADTGTAGQALDKIKDEHPTATHHCYAWRINPNDVVEFDQDDGEPGGTAGLPILNAMKSADLMNAILIVVRYYGGTKLGKAGLIDAYGHTGELCIESADLKPLVPIQKFKITYDYSRQSIINKLKNDFTWIEIDASYLQNVTVTCGCPKEEAARFEKSLLSRQHHFDDVEVLEESWVIRS